VFGETGIFTAAYRAVGFSPSGLCACGDKHDILAIIVDIGNRPPCDGLAVDYGIRELISLFFMI